MDEETKRQEKRKSDAELTRPRRANIMEYERDEQLRRS